MEFNKILRDRRAIIIPWISVLFLSASALGFQRTGLSVYTQNLSGLFSSYIIVGAALSLAIFGGAKASGNFLGGQFSTKYGRNRTSQFGSLLILSGSLFLAFAKTIGIFMVGNFIVGLGIGLLFASAAISLTDVATIHHRAKAISLMELSVYVGTSVGSLISGKLADNYGFDILFKLSFSITIVLLIVSVFLSDTVEYSKDDDVEIFLTAKEKLSTLLVKWEQDPDTNHLFDDIKINYSKGLENNDKVSKSKKYFLTNPSFLLILSSGIVSRISDTAMIILFPLLILEYGFSPVELGVFISFFTICWSIGIGLSGSFADSFGRKYPLVIGMFLEAFGYVILYLIGLNDWFPAVIVGVIIAGLGRGIYFPIPPSASTDFVSSKRRPQILGFYRFVLDLGYVVGAILIILLIEPRANGLIDVEIIEPAMIIVFMIILLQGLLLTLFFKDPRPGFRQLPQVNHHLELIQGAINHLTQSIDCFTNLEIDKGKEQLVLGKEKERIADQILEEMTHRTYSGLWRATDAIEILQFSTKTDKAVGYTIRAVRKLYLVKDELPQQFLENLKFYSKLLSILVETTKETFELISVRFNLAVRQSYQVNYVEELLDEIHRRLWKNLIDCSDTISPLSLLLLTSAIESLEKGANTLEDAAELIRLISFKH